MVRAERGFDPMPSTLPVPQWIAWFINERRYLKGVSPKTVEWYQCSFRALAPYIDQCTDELELKAGLKQGIMAMLAANTNPITLNDRIRCLNAWLHWLEVERHVSQRIRLSKVKEPQKVVPTLTPEQIRRFAAYRPDSPTGKRVHAAACLILDCGARLNEVLQLKVGDLLPEDLLVRINGKGGKQRVVPLSPQLRRLLWPWIRSRPAEEYLFSTVSGRPLGIRNARRDLHVIFRRLGIQGPRLSWHALRHTFAVNYIRAGGDVFRLQRILGHSTLEMTRHYVNLQTEDLQAVHQRFSVLARSIS